MGVRDGLTAWPGSLALLDATLLSASAHPPPAGCSPAFLLALGFLDLS